ncbi:VOC family protein [Rubellimicrobium aerolatum]|uniref:VOC family protein n=1 Tax=Rubellimicrobium aerolatum TaxID=490979 RepID=A0ABW0SDE9_9RHOB|nr:hypothetical protein [Rubellimicrobium aerolatum]MBP1805746.1 catechol 2,3-dioxygenase-like lactoylglutathione lyase family enzyme [Rubellimicrobium aerolatum]
MTRVLIPELVLRDPEAGADRLGRLFGFRPEGDRMVLGSQSVILSAGEPDGRHGRIDHIALSVPDLGAALRECVGRGAHISDATPEGPVHIAEFWEGGVDYVFLDGPEGAKMELLARRPPAPRAAWGHEHIGLSCAEFAPMRDWLLGLGFIEQSRVTLHRPGGDVEASFLAWGDDVVELYCLPETRANPTLNAGRGFWRLRAEGLDGPQTGPEGVEILPL